MDNTKLNIFKYDVEGYDKDGYNREGYDRNGYNREGYNKEGYDEKGFNKFGVYINGKKYDNEGYNVDGYDKKGYNREGYRRSGYDKEGYDNEGYNREGYDKEGYNKEGYDEKGFNKQMIHKNGTKYDENGYDCNGYDKEGYDKYGYDKRCFDREGKYRGNSIYDNYGYDVDGYNKYGNDREGYNKEGYDKEDFNREGIHKNGTKYDEKGFDKNGIHKNGTIYDDQGFSKFLELSEEGALDIAQKYIEGVYKNIDAIPYKEKTYNQMKKILEKKYPDIYEQLQNASHHNSVIRYYTIVNRTKNIISNIKKNSIPGNNYDFIDFMLYEQMDLETFVDFALKEDPSIVRTREYREFMNKYQKRSHNKLTENFVYNGKFLYLIDGKEVTASREQKQEVLEIMKGKKMPLEQSIFQGVLRKLVRGQIKKSKIVYTVEQEELEEIEAKKQKIK